MRETKPESGQRGAGSAEVSRRGVLGYLAVLSGAGALGTLGSLGLGGCSKVDHAALIAELVDLTPDREAARTVGRAFLEQTPSELDRLAARLALELDWSEGLDRATLTNRLLERIERDFRDGKTVTVNAWILSQTEAWWAAVVALA